MIKCLVCVQWLLQGQAMVYHKYKTRASAVSACIQAKCNLGKAAQTLMAEDQDYTWTDKKAAEKFIECNVNKFQSKHELSNQFQNRPPPNPKTVPAAVALQCAQALVTPQPSIKKHTLKKKIKQVGSKTRWVTYTEEIPVWERHSSIKEACQHIPLLKKMIERCHVTPAGLFKRIHDVSRPSSGHAHVGLQACPVTRADGRAREDGPILPGDGHG